MISNKNQDFYHQKIQIAEQNNYNYIAQIHKEEKLLSKNNNLILNYPINTLEDFMSNLILIHTKKYNFNLDIFSQGVEFKAGDNHSVYLLDQLSAKPKNSINAKSLDSSSIYDLSQSLSRLHISSDDDSENMKLLDEFVNNNINLYYKYMVIRLKMIIYTIINDINSTEDAEYIMQKLYEMNFSIVQHKIIYPYSKESIDKINGIIILLSNFIYKQSMLNQRNIHNKNFYRRLNILKHNINNIIINKYNNHNHKIYAINDSNKNIYIDNLRLIDEYTYMGLLYK